MTQPYYQDEHVTVLHGDCLDVLRELPDASVHSVVTDPPYGLEFMGREWDAPWEQADVNADAGFHGGGISATKNLPSFTGTTNPKCLTCKGTRRGRRDGTAKVAVCLCPDGGRFPNVRAVEMRAFQDWCEQWATECLRVLKPGGHLLAFGGSRTWHRLACAVEDAGFEIRDSIAWLYGSGFPKSLDVSKAIGKAAGAEREVVGAKTVSRDFDTDKGEDTAFRSGRPGNTVIDITAPATDAARQWSGWGTALKPAFEPVVVARKPLTGTVAANVLEHGTGALNIDGCRVGDGGGTTKGNPPKGESNGIYGNGINGACDIVDLGKGRWPTNVVLDDATAAELDRQSGTSVSRVGKPRGAANGDGWGMTATGAEYDDQGGASRFFPIFRYEAKAPTAERPKYWAHDCDCPHDEAMRPGGTCETCGAPGKRIAHPTVKPLDLMRWLVRLVTPPGGTVLEPFAGSGTTAEACVVEGFRCIAIEREADYLPLIVARLTKPIPMVLDLDGGTA